MRTVLVTMLLVLMSVIGFAQERPLWTDSLKVKLNGTYTNITPTLEKIVGDNTIHVAEFSNKYYSQLDRLGYRDFIALSQGYTTPGMFQSAGTPYAAVRDGGNKDSNYVYIERAISKAQSLRTKFLAAKSGAQIGYAIDVAPQANGAMFQIGSQGVILDGGNGGTSGSGINSLGTWLITKEAGIDSVIVFSCLSANGVNGVQLQNWGVVFDTTGQAAADIWKRASFFDGPNVNDNFRASNIRVGHAMADSSNGVINIYANGGGGLGTANLEDIYIFFSDSADYRKRWPLVIGHPGATGAVNNLNISGTFKVDAGTGLMYIWTSIRGGFIENAVYETQSEFGFQRGPVDLFVTDATYVNGFNSSLHFTVGNLTAQSNDKNWDTKGASRPHTLHKMRGDNYQDVPAGITFLNGFLNLYNHIVKDDITGDPWGDVPTWSTEIILRNYTTTGTSADNRNPAANFDPRGVQFLSDKNTAGWRTFIRIAKVGYNADSTWMYLQLADTTTGALTDKFWVVKDTTTIVNP